MLKIHRVGGALALTTALTVVPAAAASAHPASAHPAGGRDARHAVFVQLNGLSGNEIAVFGRAADGTLTRGRTYATGGRGGLAAGAPVDALASQGSLTLARDRRVLLAVNAGSDSVTSFRVRGERLARRSVVPSRGHFPVSVTAHDGLVYALNAGGAGSISGFRLGDDGTLRPLPGSTRSLGLANAAVPAFLTAPAQVGFTADGRHLLVTTKANGTLLVFGVGRDGRPSAVPVVNASAEPVPFSFVTGPRGTVQVANAGNGTTASYAVGRDGRLRHLGSSAPSGQAALCWSVRAGRSVFGANAGSATLTSWTLGRDGRARLARPVAAATSAGPVDVAATPDGRFLVEQAAGAGALDVLAVGAAGELTPVQTVTGLPAFGPAGGMEGIAAD